MNMLMIPPYLCLRWTETHHRSRNHQKGDPPRLRHVSVPAHEPAAGLRVPGGLPGDHVSSVQVPRALRQAALPFSTHPQIQPETQMPLIKEVTGKGAAHQGTGSSPRRRGSGGRELGGACELRPSSFLAHSCRRKHSTRPDDPFVHGAEGWTPLPRCHPVKNTNPIICTETRHGSLQFFIYSFPLVSFTLSFIPGEALLLCCGPKSRTQIFWGLFFRARLRRSTPCLIFPLSPSHSAVIKHLRFEDNQKYQLHSNPKEKSLDSVLFSFLSKCPHPVLAGSSECDP